MRGWVVMVGDKKMRKNRKEKKYGKLVVISLFIILVTMSAAQAFVGLDSTVGEKTPYGDGDPHPLGNDPFFTWEDDFDTMEWIDPDIDMTHDVEVVNGKVQIKNTYSVWTDPAWTRLKPITLTNNVGETLYDFVVNIIVDHDPDMQDDYDDIRFKHANTPTNFLDYWIEGYDSAEASVWVEIPLIPTGSSMMYLFYGNPDAESESDFYSIFSADDWEAKWANDERISSHFNNEDAQFPDVCSDGDDEFLVAWKEGEIFWPLHGNLGWRQAIRASVYDTDGNELVVDKLVYKDSFTYYRNDNPSVAYGGGKYFIAWERYQPGINPPHDPSPYTMDIYARLAKRSGNDLQLYSTFIVCDAECCQATVEVEFDSENNRFCVVWEDARFGWTNYNIYGKLYDTNGNQIGGEKTISAAGNSQTEPWVAFDPINEQYMIVWEEGINPAYGPFSIKAGVFDKDLNQVSGTIDIATGDDDTDYIFPCVEFSEEAELYLVTWNDGNLNDDDKSGDVWGKILDESGYVVVDTFLIKSGEFTLTNIIPYLSTSFFVSYNGNGEIWGKLVSPDGEVFADDVQLSSSLSAVSNRANMDVVDEKIFVAWEDTRVDYDPDWWDGMKDVYGNLWQLNIPSGSGVSYSVGTEKKLVLEAQITSKVIEPDNLVSWHEFGVEFDGTVTFDIIDATGYIVLIEGASDGEDLSGIDPDDHTGLRLRGHLARENPSYTPTIDSWKIIYVGVDDFPPDTTHVNIPAEPNGENGWYTTNIKIELEASDGFWGSGVDTTYFRIDDQLPKEYDDTYGIRIPLDATGDQNTPWGEWDVYYFSVDKAGNVEPEKGPFHYKLDKVGPHCVITKPEDRESVPMQGGFWVEATATDVGSGIHYVGFDYGPPYDPDKNKDFDAPYTWWCDPGFDKPQWGHIIAQAHDYAGHMYEANIYVYFIVSYPFNFPNQNAGSSIPAQNQNGGSTASGSQTLLGFMGMITGQTSGSSNPLNYN